MRLVKQNTDFWSFSYGFDLALAKRYIANESCTCELNKFAQQWHIRADETPIQQLLKLLLQRS